MDNKYLSQLTKEASLLDLAHTASEYGKIGAVQLAVAPMTHVVAKSVATKMGKQPFDPATYAKVISPGVAVGVGGTALAVGAVKAIKALRAAKAAKGATTPEEASGIKRLLAKVGIGSAVGASSASV